MLHILFVILKILAIILVSILGLLLFLILIVLFVPIHYRAEVRKHEELIVKARVNWLLYLVFVRVWFINKQLHLKLRVCGICIYDNLRPKKEKKGKKSSGNSKEEPDAKKNKIYKSEELPDEAKEKLVKSDAPKIKDNVAIKIQGSEGILDERPVEKLEEFQALEKKIEEENEEKLVEKSVERSAGKSVERVTEITLDLLDPNEDMQESIDQAEEFNDQTIESRKKQKRKSRKLWVKVKKISAKILGICMKIKNLFRKFFGIGGKVKSLMTKVKAKLHKISDLMKGLWEKKTKITTFFKDEINKAGIKLEFRQVLKAIKHCAPRKISGYVRYGTGDPCSTGEAFAVAAFFYGRYGDSLKLMPDFEEEVLEAEVMVKGRIRIFTLLIIGIKLIRDKNFRKLLKSAKQLKEEL